MSDFITELRRRKVFRVAVVYCAATFAVLEAADLILPRLGVPEQAMTLIVILMLLGFPVALGLAWALELTPDGVGVTPAAPHAAEPVPALIGRRTILVASALVLTGLAFGAGWIARPGAVADMRNHGVSVAVLPFADLSDDRSQEYLGDGIAEELLNTLRMAEIAVASRTSSFAFKGRNLSARTIGQELGVDHIVDGSVRKWGDRLRITAQVIDIRSDRPLWSETFERAAGDVFRIQDEVAAAIAAALHVRFSNVERITAGTRDAEAYDLYLLGLYHWNQRTPDGLLRALDVFTEAAERDPGFARAWAGLAFVYSALPEYVGYDPVRAYARGREVAERAVRLDPQSAEARTALGSAMQRACSLPAADGSRNTERCDDRDAAIREYDRAIELDPSFPTAHHWRAMALTEMGKLQAGEEGLRQALRLDPASLPIQTFLAMNLELQRRTEDALAESEAVLARSPRYRNALFISFVYGAQLGRAREFEPRLRDYLSVIGEDPASATVIVDGILDPRLRASAIEEVEAIVARREAQNRGIVADLWYLVDLFALLRVPDRTLEMLEAEPEWYLMLGRTGFDFIRDEPRFQALVARQRAMSEPQ